MECDDHHCAVEATSANIVIVFVFHFCLYFHLYFVFAFIFVFVFVWSWSMEYDDHHRAVEATSANRLEIHSHWIYLISKSPQPYHMTVEMEIDFAQNCFIRTMHRYDVPCRNHKRVTFFLLRHVVYTACRALPPFVPGSEQANLMCPKNWCQGP